MIEDDPRPALTADERTQLLRKINEGPRVADRAITHLLLCMDDTAVAGRVYARRHRIKAEADVERKITTKRKLEKGKENYSWDEITDIVGIRFITLYRDDIATVTEAIIKALLDILPEKGKSPFKRSDFQEFRLYLSNTVPNSDPLANRVSDIVSRHWKPTDIWKYKGPELGERYSSIHIVTWMHGVDNQEIRIPIEIQIRSVFEDAWGEVDHALLYETRRQGAPLEGVLLQIERQSNALKKMMDAAADFADAIRSLKTLENAPYIPLSPTIDGPNYVENVCRAIGVPDETLNRVMDLIRQKDELDRSLAKGSPGRTSMLSRGDYIRIADELSSLHASLETPGAFLDGRAPGRQERELGHILRMEEAVSRLLSNDPSQLHLAIDQLSQVTREFPSHPVAWLRLGEASVRLLETLEPGDAFELAAAQGDHAFQQAAIARERLSELNEREHMFAASPVHESFIDQNLARLHAYLCWRSDHLRRRDRPYGEAALLAARRALEMTLEARAKVTEAAPRRLLLGSLVFYAAEVLDISQVLGRPGSLPCTKAELHESLDEMTSWAVDLDAEQRLPLWDSVAYLQWKLDGDARANDAAKQVLLSATELAGRPQRVVSDYRREMEAKALERALTILGITQPLPPKE